MLMGLKSTNFIQRLKFELDLLPDRKNFIKLTGKMFDGRITHTYARVHQYRRPLPIVTCRAQPLNQSMMLINHEQLNDRQSVQ